MKDQFIEMLKRFRDLDYDQDFSFINNKEQEMYTKEIIGVSKASKHQNLSESFPNCSLELKNILGLMLQINPYFRPTAS